MTLKIIGTGSSAPAYTATNDYLATLMDTSDEWISSRTGIKERRLVNGETTTSMAVDAARKAMEEAGIQSGEIDLIIVGTLTADGHMPATACLVQNEIGAEHAVAYDLNAACSGFMFALNSAYAFIKAGIYQTALIIGAETLSKIVDWEDRSTCVLFGDGAGAAVVTASEVGMQAMLQYSDGSKGHVLTCEGRQIKNPVYSGEEYHAYVKMEGQEVFKFAVKKAAESIQKLLSDAKLQDQDIKYYLMHQANQRIIQSTAKRLQVSMDKFPMNLEKYGNTSAASIPILLDEVNKKGMLNRGDTIILCGFGGGLTWSAALLTW